MDPRERTVHARAQRVRDVGELARVDGLLEVLVLEVAVAKVVPELDVWGHPARVADETIEHSLANVTLEVGREDLLEDAELGRGVPLERELLVRHDGRDLFDLTLHRRLVRGFERQLEAGHDERTDRRERGREADLEPPLRREVSGGLQV